MACTIADIEGIGATCETNAPGLVEAYWALLQDVSTIPAPDPDTNTISSDITMAATKTFFTVGFSRNKGEFRYDIQGEIDARSWFHEIELFLAKQRDSVVHQLFNVTNADLIFIVKDKNGQQWLLGDLENPMNLNTAPGTTGKGGTDVNGTTATWRVDTIPHTPYLYDGVVPLVAVP